MRRIQKNRISTSKLVEYKDSRIVDIIDQIHDDELVLPSLQRKFVWKDFQITSLFDSIMQDYPIGTFMFWTIGRNKLDQKIKDKMKFYQFVSKYKKKNLGGGDEVYDKDKTECVVDGQQRLTSILIGLKGTYEKHTNDCEMYINLNFLNESNFSSEDSSIEMKEDRRKYEFSFKTPNQYTKIRENYTSNGELWFPVRKVLDKDVCFTKRWIEDEDSIKKNENKIVQKRQKFLNKSRHYLEKEFNDKIIDYDWDKYSRTLIILWNKIHVDKIVSYFPLSKISLPDIIEIFIRVNNSGTNLTRTEMLMSVVSSIWRDGRDKIDELIKDINLNGYEFDTDFIMRASLVILDERVLVNTNNVLRIANKLPENWQIISSSVKSAIIAIERMGFTKSILRSKNAVIPIAYYYSKVKDKTYDAKDEQQMMLYLHSVLILGFYGTHGDTALADIRKAMVKNADSELGPFELRDIHKKGFNFKDIANQYTKEVSEGKIKKELIIARKEQITDLLKTSYGSKSFIILACMNKELIKDNDKNRRKNKSGAKVHQDHLYPQKGLSLYNEVIKNNANLELQGYLKDIDGYLQKDGMLYETINSLANIHIFEDFKNREKQNIEPQTFFDKLDQDTIQKHKKENFIPLDKKLTFKNFHDIISERKELMRNKLNLMFNIEE